VINQRGWQGLGMLLLWKRRAIGAGFGEETGRKWTILKTKECIEG